MRGIYDTEKCLKKSNKQKAQQCWALNYLCGEWGIRTRGPFNKSTVFKTAAIDHSANSPLQKYKVDRNLQMIFTLIFNKKY